MSSKRKKIRLAVKERLFCATSGHCWYCGIALRMASANDDGMIRCQLDTFVVDHVVPKHKGGDDHFDNLVAACHSCNSSKGAMEIEEFREWHVRKQGGSFTEAQVNFWKSRGITLPALSRSEYPIFFGER